MTLAPSIFSIDTFGLQRGCLLSENQSLNYSSVINTEEIILSLKTLSEFGFEI